MIWFPILMTFVAAGFLLLGSWSKDYLDFIAAALCVLGPWAVYILDTLPPGRTFQIAVMIFTTLMALGVVGMVTVLMFRLA
jgi:hypothetical protein